MSRSDLSVINQMFGAGAGAQDALFPTPIFNSGWTAAYEDPTSGLFPEREYFNFLFRGLYALGKELNNRGVLEWNALCNYTHPAVCMGSDGVLRQSLQNSGPDYGGAKDPVGNPTYWRGLNAGTATSLDIPGNGGFYGSAHNSVSASSNEQSVKAGDVVLVSAFTQAQTSQATAHIVVVSPINVTEGNNGDGMAFYSPLTPPYNTGGYSNVAYVEDSASTITAPMHLMAVGIVTKNMARFRLDVNNTTSFVTGPAGRTAWVQGIFLKRQ